MKTGETVTLTAAANDGYEFIGWEVTGATVSDDMANPLTITVEESSVTATAFYSAKSWNISTQTEGTGTGTIMANDRAKTDETVEVLVEADEGSTLASLVLEENTSGEETTLEVDETGTATFTMPADSVTLTATFTAVGAATVHFMDKGEEYATKTVTIGGSLGEDFPSAPAEPNGNVFVAWTTGASVSPDGSDIKQFKADTIVTEDITVNAVYAKGTGANWNMVTSADGLTSGDTYVIAALLDNNYYFMNGKASSGHAGVEDVGLSSENVSFADTDLPDGAAKLIIEENSENPGYYYIYTNTTPASYFTATAAKGSLSWSETASESFAFSFDQNDTLGFVLTGALGSKVSQSTSTNKTTVIRNYASTGSYYKDLYLFKYENDLSDYTLEPSEVQPSEEYANDLMIIANYDRNMTIEPEMLVDTEVVGERTVENILLALMEESTDWSEEIDLDNSGNATAMNDLNDAGEFVIEVKPYGYDYVYTFAFYVELSDGSSDIGTVTIKAGETVYCEETNSMFTTDDGTNGVWADCVDMEHNGGKAVSHQDVKEVDSDYDSHYVDCAVYSGNTAKFTTVYPNAVDEGAAATQKWPTLTFEFWGSGFELISAASSAGGAAKIQVDEIGTENSRTNVVSTYYGGSYDEENGWQVNPDQGGQVCQAPIAVYDLGYGHYQVTVTAVYSTVFDYAGFNSYQFLFDGARIIDPLNKAETGLTYDETSIHDALDANMENVVLFIDGKGELSAADALAYGPANEIYLAPDQSIAMVVTSDVNTTLSIGARAFTGEAATLEVYKADSTTLTTPIQTINLTTATEMHYVVGGQEGVLVGEDKIDGEGTGYTTGVLVFRNGGSAPLALTSLSYSTECGVEVAINDQVYAVASNYVARMAQHKQAFADLTDVESNAWYYNSVKFAVESGIMAGVGDNKFAPSQELTRAMAVRVLYVLAGKPETQAQHSFTDVAADAWYADAVAWGAANGIVAGVSETKFDPNGKLTREQMVAFLYRYAANGQTVADRLDSFTDSAQVSGYAVNAMNWAIANGIVSGMGNGTLAPKGTATRAQMASILAHCDVLYAN